MSGKKQKKNNFSQKYCENYTITKVQGLYNIQMYTSIYIKKKIIMNTEIKLKCIKCQGLYRKIVLYKSLYNVTN